MRLITLPGVPGRGSYTALTSYLSAGTSVIASTPLHISCHNARGFGAPGKRQPMPMIAIGSISPPFSLFPIRMSYVGLLEMRLEAVDRFRRRHSMQTSSENSYCCTLKGFG